MPFLRKIAPLVSGLFLLCGCGGDKPAGEAQISVSIEPLRYLVKAIAGPDFAVNVLVPAGSGPETYEPTAAQMRRVANSAFYVQIGLIDFEKHLSESISKNMPSVGLVHLSEGILLLEGSCSHGEGEHHGHHHHHGVDPHIWSSPKNLKIMAGTLYEALAARYPDSVHYRSNYEALLSSLDSLDRELSGRFASGNTHFIVYHPALGYLARDYSLTQIALEDEGKEPSADHLRRLVDTARRWNIPRILYQRQFSRNTVETLARELGVEAVAIDPLGYEVEENLREISRLIAQP